MNLVDRNAGYSDFFYQQLETLNAEKEHSAPVALVVKSGSREACITDEAKILQMGKTHRIALQIIDQDRPLRHIIQDTFQTTGARPKKLVWLSHANEMGDIELGIKVSNDDDSATVYWFTGERSQEEDFIDLDKNAQIFLSGCSTGRGFPSLAQRIADISKRTVFAPSETLERPMTCFLESPNGRWKMLSYSLGELQHVYKFKPDTLENRVLRETLTQALSKHQDIKNQFQAYADWMQERALVGDAGTQIKMADFCVMRAPGFNPAHAVHWLLTAAQEHNDVDAQCQLGLWYHNGVPGIVDPSYESAFFWFRLAADQGHPDALNNVGVYLDNGWGCERSERQAALYFQKAADKGHPNALFVMGKYSELGLFGLKASKQNALFYHGLALKRGYQASQRELDRLLFELKLEGATPEVLHQSIEEPPQQIERDQGCSLQ